MKNKGYAKFGGGRGGSKNGALWEMWKWPISGWSMIIRVSVVLSRTVLEFDSRFNNLCGS